MSDELKPTPNTFDHSSYSKVLIYTTGEVNGHEYKRGLTYFVDDQTYHALDDAKLISDPDAVSKK